MAHIKLVTMKRLLISVVLIFLSLNINAAISQSGITNLKQLDKNGIIDLVSGNQLTGFISDGPFEGPITQTYFKDGRYETVYEDKVYKGRWKAQGESFATREAKKMCTKNNNATNWSCFYWYTGNKDGGTYAYIIAQGLIFHQYHKVKSVIQVKADAKKKAEEKKKALERKRLVNAKKAEEKKKAEERKRLAAAKKAEEKKKAEERKRLVNAKKAEEKKKIAEQALNKKLALIPPTSELIKAQDFLNDIDDFVANNPSEFDIMEIAMFKINTKLISEGVINADQIFTLSLFKKFGNTSSSFIKFQEMKQEVRKQNELNKVNKIISNLNRKIDELLFHRQTSSESLTPDSIDLIDSRLKSSTDVLNNSKILSELEQSINDLNIILSDINREVISTKKLTKMLDSEKSKINQNISRLKTYLAENISSISLEVMALIMENVEILEATKRENWFNSRPEELKELQKVNKEISNFIVVNNL